MVKVGEDSKWRWVLVNTSPNNQEGIGVSTFLACEGTSGMWDLPKTAECGVLGTEQGCFGAVCLETDENDAR